MLLEFFTNHHKMLIITCILAAYGIFHVIENFIRIIHIVLFYCPDSDAIDILCYILGLV